MLINTALELCEHVHVYGFWPFGTDLQNNSVPYHYYDELSPHRYIHKMPEEFVAASAAPQPGGANTAPDALHGRVILLLSVYSV